MLVLAFTGVAHVGCAGLLPALDPCVNDMFLAPAPRPKLWGREAMQPVPARIHQICLTCARGDASACTVHPTSARWAAYARQFGYAYRLWTQDDLPEMSSFLDTEAASLVAQAVAADAWPYASEVLRVAVLHRIGGAFVDQTLTPPSTGGAWVDLRQLVPMAGLVASTASEGRNVGTSAVLLTTGLLLSPPAHPVLAHLLQSYAANHAAWARRHPPFDAQYAAGIYAFNRALTGAFAVVPHTFLVHLGMAQSGDAGPTPR